jgi:outer membrane receptor protein involved in Fe transport
MNGKRRLQLFATAMTASLLGAASGLAQTAQSADTGAPSTDVGELVVTGSRIPTANLTSIQPISTLTGENIQKRGFTNLADALNELPITGAGVTPIGSQNSFGVGVNYPELFSLGAQRTLTLVDGYRYITDNPTNIFANNGGTQVDLNDLPTLFVDRIETVPATGAAVYGSDAIAGVVNVIMKQKYVGEELVVQHGFSTYADAPHTTVEVALGHNFLDDKLNVGVDFQYDQTGYVLNSDRSFTAADYAFAPNPTGGPPGSILIKNDRFSGVTIGGLPFTLDGNLITLPTGQYAQFGANGNLVNFNPGRIYPSFASGLIGGVASGGDSLDTAPLEALQSPVDRKVVSAMASYDFSDHLKVHATFNYSHIDSQSIDQPNYASIAFGGAPSFNDPFAGGALLISPDNAFLTPQAKAVLAANGVGADGFYLSRANSDLAAAPYTASSDTYNVNLQVQGDFEVFAHRFDWTADWARGANWSRFDTPNIVYGNEDSGGSVPNLFGYATDSVLVNGQPECRVKAQNPGSTNPYIANCVPLNPFGADNYNAAALKYVTADFGDHSLNKHDDLQFNIHTDVVKLPGGEAKIGLGYEYRREEASFTPSPASAEGIGYSVPISGQSGAYETSEFYVEGTLPILGPGFNLPFAQKFDLNGAYRKVHNNLAGDNEAWNFGGTFSPVPDITLRGSRSKTFVAPALTDLFASNTPAYDSGTDPCQASNLSAGPNPAARKANCLAAFTALEGGNAAAGAAALAAFTNSNVENFTIPITASGNPHLENEVGNSFTYGLVLQPRWIPGLSISGDYIEINITNAIEFAGIANLLENCYDAPTYPSATCGDFTRQAAGTTVLGSSVGQVLSANETFINEGYIHYAGAEYKLDYRRAINRLPFVRTLRDLGKFDFDLDVINNRRLVTSISGLGFDAINTAGALGGSNGEGSPRWRWVAQLRYQIGPFEAGWTTHFVGDSYYDLTYTNANQDILKVGRNYTHDLSLSYDITRNVTVQLNINNITNEAPPYPVAGYTVGYYDFIGRMILLQARAKF